MGSVVAYEIGAGWGRAGIERYGKYVLMSRHDLDLADGWFARRGEMTVFVVDAFEVVEVYHHDGERVLGPSTTLDGYFNAVAEQGAGGKPGEGIVMRDMVDVFVGALALSQVIKDSDIPADRFLTVTKRGDYKLHGNARPIFPGIRPFSFVDEAPFRGKSEYVMIGEDFAIELG